MTFDAAQRATEVLMAVAFLQQGVEHLVGPTRDRRWAVGQIALSVGIAAGIAPLVLEAILLLVSVGLVRHFGGPYNGGSDRMRLLVLTCLIGSRAATGTLWQQAALGYLAVQVVLSYAMAGWVKLANPDWRCGRALRDVFAFSVYPVSDALRRWAAAPGALLALSWVTMTFEALFPVALLSHTVLPVALAIALAFHLANACVFGLNRFAWIWLAGYPCLLWFQHGVLARLLVF